MSSNGRHSEWLDGCRRKLIEMETKNIRQRASSWTEIVNNETSKINSMLTINTHNYPTVTQYIYNVPNPLKYLTFLSEWNGIKTRNSSSQPTSYLEFESKAKNWLNGRRAPNYGNTLFPDMITSSYNYSKQLSLQIFGNIPINKLSSQPNGDSLQNLYHKTLLFAYLHKLCSERIAVHQSWKKTNLLCENSVKNMHAQTAKLLQQYAIHDYTKNDLNSFPGSLQRSSAFYSQQHNAYLARLIQAYNAFKCHNNNNNTIIKQQRGDVSMGDMHTNMNMNAGNSCMRRPDLNVNYVAIKSSEYANIMDRLSALEQKHNDQASQISSLTTKCQALQQQIEVSNAPSTIASIPSTSGGIMNQYVEKLSSNENDPSEYYNDHSFNSMDCSIQTNNTQNTIPNSNKQVLVMHGHRSHSPSINSHHSSHDTHSTYTTQPINPIIPMQPMQPMPFEASRSLPPQLNMPSFNTTTNNNPKQEPDTNNNITLPDRKSFDLSYQAPPQISSSSSSTSMPQFTSNSIITPNNNNNFNYSNYNDYSLSLQNTTVPSTYNMYANNNTNTNTHDSNPNQIPNNEYYNTHTPSNNNLNLMMLDHNNSTPNQPTIFAYSPLSFH